MFAKNVVEGVSAVKQMIMGAGKTTIVAPLLGLMLADGKQLLLSVVPKSLLEMSRQRMRESFSSIMPKRIYTFSLDRSSEVTPATRKSLENAIRNRGIVVATPTSVKSCMLNYLETQMQLAQATSKKQAAILNAKASELAKVLKLFNEGELNLKDL